MTREYEPDPEVVADLQLRARTARERPRTEAQVDKVLAWQPPEIVGQWRCRTCGSKFMPITADALEYARMWNRILQRRGEAPLDPERIVFCDDCRELHRSHGADKRRDEVDRMAEEVRKLKNAADPTSEQATIRTLRELGHPDVDGLVHSLTAKAAGRLEKSAAKKARASL